MKYQIILKNKKIITVVNLILICVIFFAYNFNSLFDYVNKAKGGGYVETKLVYDIVDSWDEKLKKLEAQITPESCDKVTPKLEHFISSIPALKQTHRLTPIKVRAYSDLIQCYITIEDLRVPEAFQKVIELDPLNYTLYTSWALYEYDQGNYQASLDIMEESLAIHPDYMPSHEVQIKNLHSLRKTNELTNYLKTIEGNRISPVENGDVFFGNTTQGFHPTNRTPFNNVIADGAKHTYPIAMQHLPIFSSGEVTKLRIDPISNDEFIITMHAIEFLNQEGEVLFTITDFSSFKTNGVTKHSNNSYFSETNDPYIFITFNESFAQTASLNIIMSVEKVYSQEVLDIISNYQ